ncbi:MAG: hypothetical protein U0R78_18760 [Nocardioidaceae bacterium]
MTPEKTSRSVAANLLTSLNAGEVAASVGGGALAVATRTLGLARAAVKPLHPEGETRLAVVRRHGSPEPTGVAWLDETGVDDVLVRQSRAVGIPAPLPDIHGVAIRVPTSDGAVGDLLLASTGWGRLTRFVLTAGPSAGTRPMTTLLPYRTDRGPLLIGARSSGPDAYVLAWTVGAGAWRIFGALELGERVSVEAGDARISFDPVQHRLPGLEQYPTVMRLREPAYAGARATSERSTMRVSA